MINPLTTTLALPGLMQTQAEPFVSRPQIPLQPLPIHGQPFICPVTKTETQVVGVIVEEEAAGTHANHWWGCWACAGLYWKPGMAPVQKAWHVVRVATHPEPSDADYLAQLITEFVAMRDVAEAVLVDLPPDTDYAGHLDELLAQCRAIVQAMRERDVARRISCITVKS